MTLSAKIVAKYYELTDLHRKIDNTLSVRKRSQLRVEVAKVEKELRLLEAQKPPKIESWDTKETY